MGVVGGCCCKGEGAPYVHTHTHTHEYAGIHDMVAALNAEHGWDVPIHVDAVSVCVLH